MQRVLGGLRSARQYSSSATIALHGVHQLPTEPAGYVELRQYTLHPDGMKAYLKLTGDHVESRKQRTPFLGCCSPPPFVLSPALPGSATAETAPCIAGLIWRLLIGRCAAHEAA